MERRIQGDCLIHTPPTEEGDSSGIAITLDNGEHLKVDQPITDGLRADQPITEQLSVNQPTEERLKVDKQITEQLMVYQPITEELQDDPPSSHITWSFPPDGMNGEEYSPYKIPLPCSGSIDKLTVKLEYAAGGKQDKTMQDIKSK